MPEPPNAPVRLARMPQTLLSFVAGYVDSCTFLALFGLFVAQVTGSFVYAGAQIVVGDTEIAAKVLGIPVFLLAGFATTLIVIGSGRGRRAIVWTLLLEAALLAGFLAAGLLGAPLRSANQMEALVASLCGLAAMGVQSAAVRLLSTGGGSTNVMTTNTTLLAIDAAEILLGWMRCRRSPVDEQARDQLAAASRRFAALWPLIFGFLIGTAMGAIAFVLAGLTSLAIPIAVVFGIILWALFTSPKLQAASSGH